MRQVPAVASISFTGSNSTITLDGSLRLQSIGLCPSLACLARGAATAGETGANDYASWGRWTGGNATVRILGLPAAVPLGSNQGIHYLVGVPTVSMPTSGTFSYTLLGSTRPTISDGSMAPGSFWAHSTVAFSSGSQTRIGLEGRVTMPAGTINFSAPLAGGPAGSLAMSGTSTFSGRLAGTGSLGQTSSFACGAGGCSVDIQGAFYGPAAAQMGLGYTVSGTGNRTISGVGVLQKGP